MNGIIPLPWNNLKKEFWQCPDCGTIKIEKKVLYHRCQKPVPDTIWVCSHNKRHVFETPNPKKHTHEGEDCVGVLQKYTKTTLK